MNSIMNFLKFTLEIAEDFPGNKLPTLDLKIWISTGNIVMHEFFEKPMAANVVVQAGSALGESVKVASLTEEVVRRLKHTSLNLPNSSRMEALEALSQKMSNSGHMQSFMKRIMMKGIVKFERKLALSKLNKDDKSYKPLHNPSGTSVSRFRKKMMSKQNWFREKEMDDEIGCGEKVSKGWKISDETVPKGCSIKNFKKTEQTTVMFVPNTKGSILLKRLQAREDEMANITGFRIKFQEAGGIQLCRMFNQNLARFQPCGRLSYWPCKSGKEGATKKCKQRSVLYETSCCICNPNPDREPNERTDHSNPEGDANITTLGRDKKKNPDLGQDMAGPSPTTKGRVGIYYGETSRSLFERASEHVTDARKFSDKSHIIKHWMEEHPELNNLPEFRFRVIRKYRDCLSRQLGEALIILTSEDKLLNSKNEYISNSITKLTVQEGAIDKKMREMREEQKDKEAAENRKNFKENIQPQGR